MCFISTTTTSLAAAGGEVSWFGTFRRGKFPIMDYYGSPTNDGGGRMTPGGSGPFTCEIRMLSADGAADLREDISKQTLGREAMRLVTYVECAEDGKEGAGMSNQSRQILRASTGGSTRREAAARAPQASTSRRRECSRR